MSSVIDEFLNEAAIVARLEEELVTRRAGLRSKIPVVLAVGADAGNTADVGAIAAQIGQGLSIPQIEAAPATLTTAAIAGSEAEFADELARREAQIRKAVALAIVLGATAASGGGGAAGLAAVAGALRGLVEPTH